MLRVASFRVHSGQRCTFNATYGFHLFSGQSEPAASLLAKSPRRCMRLLKQASASLARTWGCERRGHVQTARGGDTSLVLFTRLSTC
jgi:hypothetical protein